MELARGLVETARALGTPTSALVTDMSQPLGRWSGHTAEVMETFACLAGEGPEDLMEVTFDNGRVGAKEAERISALIWGRLDVEPRSAAGSLAPSAT